MAKFLIVALVALPVCLSLSLGLPKLDKEAVISQLKDDFELTPDDLKKECKVDFQKAWRKIGAALDNFNAIYTEYALDYADSDGKLKKRYFAKCRRSEPYNKARIDVIKTALPCAEKDSLDKHVKMSEAHTC